MRNSYKNIEDRRKHILDILSKEKTVQINQLSQRLDVSQMTIRRDCNKLASMGRLTQHLGVLHYVSPEKASKSITRERIKKNLGIEAAKRINDNKIVFINSSSTAIYAIPDLLKKNVTIITNNGNAMKFLTDKDNATLILSGGSVKKNNVMKGDIANRSFLSMRSDWGIIGCAGLSLEHGISTPFIDEATVNRNIVKNSRHLIVCADYSKFDSFSNFTIGSISDIDILITDTFVDGKILENFRHHGVEVVQVPQF
ncbi:DeoR/GlpR family DNA-binding transcription regulator [uncultured Limosilactobacillus sp.]|uniref:DeoR/GlpR family DNA-binding transcription regulator n=1 Tax=uncultured Limosilactobacillus sp. TaxID=2837629 RepID=UPI0025F24E36|nr:DeoR/GlpR family DNA-binding transcription regulator [uncultured Limosilactobacillus sp.]